MSSRAIRTVWFLGWRGYDAPLGFGSCLESNALALERDFVWEDQTIVDHLSSGGTGRVDVISPDLKFVPRMVEAGVCAPLDRAKLVNHEKLLSYFRSHPDLEVDGRLYAVPFTWGAHPLIYRPDLVSEPPSSWLDCYATLALIRSEWERFKAA